MPTRSRPGKAAPLIKMSGISMTYGAGAAAVRALRDVSLDVNPGEVLLLLGPSGSGKTTLLQVLGGLLHPTEGSVTFGGQRLGDLDEKQLCEFRLRRFGFVFQSYNLFPTLSAWENIAIGCELRGVNSREAEDRSRELLSYVGLAHRAEAFPRSLSGGEKQRVAIARAIAGDPEVILADEPTAALDAGSGMRIAELLRELAHKAGRAIVIVTHDPRLLKIGDRIVVLEDGAILSQEQERRGARPTPLHAGVLI
ncbi:MAG TPA: ABC transporter ATP-binding protein [Stellaceae bacterium]|nr:ABC transporter ATP-binding protein [Stellaceae bacterium]